VVEKDDGEELLIIVRGTVTLTEGRLLTFDDQVSFFDIIEGSSTSAAADPMIREGYGELLRAVFPSLRRIVEASMAERVVVTGFSLGSTVASYIALGLATTFSDSRVDLVAFSPLRGFDQTFADLLVETLNVRSLAFEFDFIPEAGCETFPGCSADETPKDELRIVEYVDFPGRVEISGEEIGEPNDINSPLQVWPAHLCSYLCWAVRNFQPEDEVDWCERAPRGGNMGGVSEASICPYSVERLPLL